MNLFPDQRQYSNHRLIEQSDSNHTFCWEFMASSGVLSYCLQCKMMSKFYFKIMQLNYLKLNKWVTRLCSFYHMSWYVYCWQLVLPIIIMFILCLPLCVFLFNYIFSSKLYFNLFFSLSHFMCSFCNYSDKFVSVYDVQS
jgi:hypothetical protein